MQKQDTCTSEEDAEGEQEHKSSGKISITFCFSGIISTVIDGLEFFSLGHGVYGVLTTVREGDCPAGFDATAHSLARLVEEKPFVPLTSVRKKPAGLTFDEAAMIPSAAQAARTSLLDKAQLTAGQNVLVLSGDSSVGIMAISIAKDAGAW